MRTPLPSLYGRTRAPTPTPTPTGPTVGAALRGVRTTLAAPAPASCAPLSRLSVSRDKTCFRLPSASGRQQSSDQRPATSGMSVSCLQRQPTAYRTTDRTAAHNMPRCDRDQSIQPPGPLPSVHDRWRACKHYTTNRLMDSGLSASAPLHLVTRPRCYGTHATSSIPSLDASARVRGGCCTG